MDIRIIKKPDGGVIGAIPSKSAAHRLLIAAAMSGISLDGLCEGLSADITATKDCLRNLLSEEEPRMLPCGESGSTLRFLMPLAGVLGIRAAFCCEGRLADRPMEELLEAMRAHGCAVEGHNPKIVSGRMRGGSYQLAGNISSQYVTGLLMALPLAQDDSEIRVKGRLQSRPYVDLTLQVLAKAGVRVAEREEEKTGDTVFSVPGRQQYRLPLQEAESVEGDWSNSAFWLVMDAMLPETIECRGLDPKSRQGDRRISAIIREMKDADTEIVSIDVSDVPDLVPAIAVLACARPASSVTEITGAGRLRFKESDRLVSVSAALRALGADVTEQAEGLVIRSRERLSGGEVDSCNDHRIVMMSAAAACVAEGEILIRNARAVDKSYPRFFEDYGKLGGEVQWL